MCYFLTSSSSSCPWIITEAEPVTLWCLWSWLSPWAVTEMPLAIPCHKQSSKQGSEVSVLSPSSVGSTWAEKEGEVTLAFSFSRPTSTPPLPKLLRRARREEAGTFLSDQDFWTPASALRCLDLTLRWRHSSLPWVSATCSSPARSQCISLVSYTFLWPWTGSSPSFPQHKTPSLPADLLRQDLFLLGFSCRPGKALYEPSISFQWKWT